MAETPEKNLRAQRPRDEEEPDDAQAVGRCPICEHEAGECDHLLASIDLTYSEIVAGALFAQAGAILDLMEYLAARDTDDLKVAGAGPILEFLATLVRDEMEAGAGAGDALAVIHPQIIAAVSQILQEDDDVTAIVMDPEDTDDSAVENLWAVRPERIVGQLAARLEELADELNGEYGAGGKSEP
jgi:hypothetical protein